MFIESLDGKPKDTKIITSGGEDISSCVRRIVYEIAPSEIPFATIEIIMPKIKAKFEARLAEKNIDELEKFLSEFGYKLERIGE